MTWKLWGFFHITESCWKTLGSLSY